MSRLGISSKISKISVALLVSGGAILLFSCKSKPEVVEDNLTNLITMQSENFTVIQSVDGKRDYRFKTPLLERYEYAKEPYMKCPKGIYLERFDSLGVVETTITANFAICYEVRNLWEAAGSVVVVSTQNGTLETEQLSWDQKTHKIYTNADFKMTDVSGVNYGKGFVSDENLEEWSMNEPNWSYVVPENMKKSAAGGGSPESAPGGAASSAPVGAVAGKPASASGGAAPTSTTGGAAASKPTSAPVGVAADKPASAPPSTP